MTATQKGPSITDTLGSWYVGIVLGLNGIAIGLAVAYLDIKQAIQLPAWLYIMVGSLTVGLAYGKFKHEFGLWDDD